MKDEIVVENIMNIIKSLDVENRNKLKEYIDSLSLFRELNFKCFIVPNQGIRFNLIPFDFLKDEAKTRCKQIGIDIPETDNMIPVWIHSEFEDNCTDHGYSDEEIIGLGLEDPKHDICAPNYLPYSVLKDVKEGDVKTFKAPNGTLVHIKFEQLPYRYGRFGTFENILEKINLSTEDNNRFQIKMKKKEKNPLELKQELFERYPQLVFCKEEFEKAFLVLKDCYKSGRKLLVAGNGGSAADSEHIVSELMMCQNDV